MATLTKQSITRAGLVPAYVAAAAGGDKFTPDKDSCLHVKNGSAGALTVTIVTPKEVAGHAVADTAVSVPAAGERLIGSFPAEHYANPADVGLAAITYSGVTSLTLAVLTLGES